MADLEIPALADLSNALRQAAMPLGAPAVLKSEITVDDVLAAEGQHLERKRAKRSHPGDISEAEVGDSGRRLKRVKRVHEGESDPGGGAGPPTLTDILDAVQGLQARQNVQLLAGAPAGGQVLALGETPDDFPATASEARAITGVAVDALSAEYGNDFGSLPGDAAADKVVNFLEFIQGC